MSLSQRWRQRQASTLVPRLQSVCFPVEHSLWSLPPETSHRERENLVTTREEHFKSISWAVTNDPAPSSSLVGVGDAGARQEVIRVTHKGGTTLPYNSLMLVISRACNSRCRFPPDPNPPPLRPHPIPAQGGSLPQLQSSISRKTGYK